MDTNKTLCFNNGKFRILQISDLQDTKRTSVDTLRFTEAAIKKVKPDLIVLTGDQLDVFGIWGKGEKALKNVKRAIKSLFSVIEKSGVPFALTFGNHDPQTNVSTDIQTDIYKKYKNCIGFQNTDDGRPDKATFNLPILSSDKKKTSLNIYIMDTHGETPGFGLKGINEKQLCWYRKVREKLKEENGNYVPSIVFEHIPVPEIFGLFEEVKKGTKGSEPLYKNGKNIYYILKKDRLFDFYAYGETPSVQLGNCSQFEAVKEKGDVFAMYFGHDHYNSFAGKVDGIDLGYCPGAGFNNYGIKKRGVRVFDFDEDNVRNYKTYTLNYRDCCNKSEMTPFKNSLSCIAPCNIHTAGPFIGKSCLVLAAAVCLLLILYFFVSKIFIKALLTFSGAAVIIYAVTAFIANTVTRNKIIKGKNKGEAK